ATALAPWLLITAVPLRVSDAPPAVMIVASLPVGELVLTVIVGPLIVFEPVAFEATIIAGPLKVRAPDVLAVSVEALPVMSTAPSVWLAVNESLAALPVTRKTELAAAAVMLVLVSLT